MHREMSTKERVVDLLTAPSERSSRQVPRALVASALAAALDCGILALLVERCGWSSVSASVVSYLLGGVLQYVLCAIWVFPSAPQSAAFGFMAFSILSLGGLAITWVTMKGMVDVCGVYYPFAKVTALGLAFCWNFLSRKYWLFRPRKRN